MKLKDFFFTSSTKSTVMISPAEDRLCGGSSEIELGVADAAKALVLEKFPLSLVMDDSVPSSSTTNSAAAAALR